MHLCSVLDNSGAIPLINSIDVPLWASAFKERIVVASRFLHNAEILTYPKTSLRLLALTLKPQNLKRATNWLNCDLSQESRRA